MCNHEERFLELLTVLAEQTRYKLTDLASELYDTALSKFGYEEINEVLIDMIQTAKRFPTIGDIKEKLGAADIDPEAVARTIAERIFQAVGRWGSNPHYWEQIKEFIGPIGIKTVGDSRGWISICDSMTNDQATTFKAQWREYAIGLIELERKGVSVNQMIETSGRQSDELIKKLCSSTITLLD